MKNRIEYEYNRFSCTNGYLFAGRCRCAPGTHHKCDLPRGPLGLCDDAHVLQLVDAVSHLKVEYNVHATLAAAAHSVRLGALSGVTGFI